MGVTCWKCEAAWDHCHGTVIRHSLRHTECTQSDCPSPELVPHTLIIDCDVVGCDCGQPIGSAGGAVALESSG
jgi:hypothetical protein